jgi:hypothetical protein
MGKPISQEIPGKQKRENPGKKPYLKEEKLRERRRKNL